MLRGNLPENSLVEMDLDKDGEKLSFHAIPSEAIISASDSTDESEVSTESEVVPPAAD